MGCGFSKKEHFHFQKSSHSRRRRSDDHKFIEERHTKAEQEYNDVRTSSQNTTSTITSANIEHRQNLLEIEGMKMIDVPKYFQSENKNTSSINNCSKQRPKKVADEMENIHPHIQQQQRATPHGDDVSDVDSFVVIHRKVVAAWEGGEEVEEKREIETANENPENQLIVISEECQSSSGLFRIYNDSENEEEIEKVFHENSNSSETCGDTTSLVLETNRNVSADPTTFPENSSICSKDKNKINNITNNATNNSNSSSSEDNDDSDDNLADKSVENIEKIVECPLISDNKITGLNLLKSMVNVLKNVTIFSANNEDDFSLVISCLEELLSEQLARVANIWNDNDKFSDTVMLTNV